MCAVLGRTHSLRGWRIDGFRGGCPLMVALVILCSLAVFVVCLVCFFNLALHRLILLLVLY